MGWHEKERTDELLRLWLDGEASDEQLERLERMRAHDSELDAQARLLRAQQDMLERVPAPEPPPDLAAEVMQAVERERPPGRLYAFLFRPRTLTYRIATGSAAVAAVAALLVAVLWMADRTPAPDAPEREPAEMKEAPVPVVERAAPPAAGTTEEHEVVIEVPLESAQSVRLVGDFNDWREEGLALSDPDGDGIWRLELAVEPGRYSYRILVDGERWVDDPGADTRVDDGFGGTDCVRYVL
jgi:anti-sigma factor RsiW